MPVRPLSEVLAEKAKIELNETEEKLNEGIQHLREWINKQPHLRARTDDQWLAAFLRGCKHRLEKAKEKLELYYSLRHTYPDLFSFRPGHPLFQELLQTGCVLILPKLSSPVDPRVVIARPALYDPKRFGTSNVFSLSHIIQQIMYLEDDTFMVNGTVGVLDLKDVTFAHLRQVTPLQLRKLIIAGQDASPLRLKSFHIINCLKMFEITFNIVKKLLNEKHRNRIFVHSNDMDALNKHISKDILPTEYDGNGGSAKEIIDYWLKKIDEYGPWMEEDINKYGTDESLRPAKLKGSSFKSLEID